MLTLRIFYFLTVVLSSSISFASEHSKLIKFVCTQKFDATNYAVKKVAKDKDLSYERFLVSPTKSSRPFVSVTDEHVYKVVLHTPTRRVKAVQQFPDDGQNYDLLADVVVSALLSSGGGVLIEVTNINLNSYSFVSG